MVPLGKAAVSGTLYSQAKIEYIGISIRLSLYLKVQISTYNLTGVSFSYNKIWEKILQTTIYTCNIDHTNSVHTEEYKNYTFYYILSIFNILTLMKAKHNYRQLLFGLSN